MKPITLCAVSLLLLYGCGGGGDVSVAPNRAGTYSGHAFFESEQLLLSLTIEPNGRVYGALSEPGMLVPLKGAYHSDGSLELTGNDGMAWGFTGIVSEGAGIVMSSGDWSRCPICQGCGIPCQAGNWSATRSP